MRFEVLILGNSSATPAYNRHPTAQILRANSQQFLIDCGEGTQIQFQKYKVKFKNLNNIFISHLHGDHFYGLIGLITSFNLNKRTAPLNIYCPKGLEKIIRIQLEQGIVRIGFDLNYYLLEEEKEIELYRDNDISIHSFPLIHRIPTCGFVFRQLKMKLKKIIPEKIHELGLQIRDIRLIKEGKDFVKDGITIPNTELTYPSAPLKSYAFVSDTLYSDKYFETIKDVDLLYHESTFPNEIAWRAKETFHSTAREAGEVAKAVSAKKLILGHFSARYQDLSNFLLEAKEVFPNTEIAEEGKVFEI